MSCFRSSQVQDFTRNCIGSLSQVHDVGIEFIFNLKEGALFTMKFPLFLLAHLHILYCILAPFPNTHSLHIKFPTVGLLLCFCAFRTTCSLNSRCNSESCYPQPGCICCCNIQKQTNHNMCANKLSVIDFC